MAIVDRLLDGRSIGCIPPVVGRVNRMRMVACHHDVVAAIRIDTIIVQMDIIGPNCQTKAILAVANDVRLADR
jgi:hypothetical protein